MRRGSSQRSIAATDKRDFRRMAAQLSARRRRSRPTHADRPSSSRSPARPNPFCARCSPVDVPCNPPPTTIARPPIVVSYSSALQLCQLRQRHRAHRQTHAKLPRPIRTLTRRARSPRPRSGHTPDPDTDPCRRRVNAFTRLASVQPCATASSSSATVTSSQRHTTSSGPIGASNSPAGGNNLSSTLAAIAVSPTAPDRRFAMRSRCAASSLPSRTAASKAAMRPRHAAARAPRMPAPSPATAIRA